MKAEDLPAADSSWEEIAKFAQSFNAYEYWGGMEKCAELGNAARKAWGAEGEVPKSLDSLRTCLFFEHRRLRHFQRDPDAEEMKYIRALMAGVRQRFERRG
jgi:hypothetical protein